VVQPFVTGALSPSQETPATPQSAAAVTVAMLGAGTCPMVLMQPRSSWAGAVMAGPAALCGVYW